MKKLPQYEYNRVMQKFREKRKFARRLFDIMDEDTSGHDWPGLWWKETMDELQFLAIQLGCMRKDAEDRGEKLEGIKQ
jgi:hypothetical protein